MEFVGDYDVPTEECYRSAIGGGRVMLFAGVCDGSLEHAVLDFDTDGQSIEDHYAKEGRRSGRRKK